MESTKKWLNERTVKRNGVYVHYSPPRLLTVASSVQLRQWVREGATSKLERAVLNGQGHKLLADAGALQFPGHLPALVAKCDALHLAVERGSLLELQELLGADHNQRKYVTCKDEAGVGLLHKAVYYDYMDIAEWLVKHYPQLVNQRDSEGRTPLHYAAASRDEAAMAGLLEGAGAVRGARDVAGRTPGYYRGPARNRLTLPAINDMAHDPQKNPQGLVFKRHNIRIWIHDCDMMKLQKVVWEGHGTLLLTEVSNQPTVKRFLEAVPYLMNTVREIHKAVIMNDLEGLMRHAGDPVPPLALSSKDRNKMTVTHKAAGLGFGGILRYITGRYPEGVNDVDKDGRTPLHYAAAVRDEQHLFDVLVNLGADQSVMDKRNKMPGFYITRPQEIDKKMLMILPDAPRTSSLAYPPSWDWDILDIKSSGEPKKSRKRNPKASNDNTGSYNKSNSYGKRGGVMKQSSTHDYIKGLPDLNDNHVTKDKDVIEDNFAKIQPETSKPIENPKQENLVNQISKLNISEKVSENNQTANDPIDTNTNFDNVKTKEEESDEVVDDNVINVKHENIQEDTSELENTNESKMQNDQKEEDATKTNDQNKNELNTKHEIEELHQKEIKSINNSENYKNDNSFKDTEYTKEEDFVTSTEKEGTNEDDDDVQIQGETPSDYNEFNHRSTAEVSDSSSAKRGNAKGSGNEQKNVMEGIIEGKVEMDSLDASITRENDLVEGEVLVFDNEIDPEVTELINTANMEMLAALVLNGEGARLVGRRARNVELQAFLDNVPSYMKKINKVHLAAKEGDIKELQASLDRRKFAIARDPISPNGATPLHVATLYGHTNIIKYLGGRFPETLSAVDFEGRTALHYAAVLPDNGYYFNLLQQLGANAKDLDDSGRSAEDYKKNPSLLPFDQLLSDFKINKETVQKMMSDKVPDDNVSSRRTLDNREIIDTLERCFKLLSSTRHARTPLSASSNNHIPPLVIGRFLKRSVFNSIKHRVTVLDHNLFDVIWPAVKKLPETKNIIQTIEEDFSGGIIAPDYYVYAVFNEFLIPLVKDLHNINVYFDLNLHPESDFVVNKLINTETAHPLVEINIDPDDSFVFTGTIECMRNIDQFELPSNLKVGQLEEVERIVTSVLLQDNFTQFYRQSNNQETKGGTYYTLNEVIDKPSEIRATLASAGLLIALCEKQETDDTTRIHGAHWPYGRGVFVSEDSTIAIWINVHDHIRVIVSTPIDAPGKVGLAFSKMSYMITYLHKHLNFVRDRCLGYLSCRPTFIGTGLKFTITANFSSLSKDPDNMRHLCAMRGLQYRETLSPDILRLSNFQCLNTTETNSFNDFTTATANLLHLEKDLSLTSNSTQIAALLTNIFRRKKSSLADLDSGQEN